MSTTFHAYNCSGYNCHWGGTVMGVIVAGIKLTATQLGCFEFITHNNNIQDCLLLVTISPSDSCSYGNCTCRTVVPSDIVHLEFPQFFPLSCVLYSLWEVSCVLFYILYSVFFYYERTKISAATLASFWLLQKLSNDIWNTYSCTNVQ